MSRNARQLKAALACFVFLSANSPLAAVSREPAADRTVIRGTEMLDAAVLDSAGSLKVSRGATAVIDFGNSANTALAGNLVNNGKIIAVSSNANVTTAGLTANNIINRPHALISSVLPSSGLTGFSNLVANLSLNLNAVHDIVNAGTITSAGSLTVTASNSITNALPAGVTGANPVMQAANNVNLQAPSIANAGLVASQLASVNANTAQLVNSGTIQASSGSVQIANLSGNALSVDNSLGMITAQNEVLFQTLGTSSQSKASLSVVGGTISASNVSFLSPDGRIDVAVDRINGSVDASGGTVQIGVQQGNLDLGQVNLTGDPIYYALSGNLDLSGLFSSGSTFSTSGQDFVALASGNITANGALSNAVIDATTPGGNNGGAITLAAGVNFTVNDTTTNPIACNNCSGSFSITGPSHTGGNVNLPTVSFTTGNNISIQAYPGAISAGSVAVGNVQTSGNLSITTADLKLGAASLMSATGSQSMVTVNSPAGSGLTVELPSGSYATIQTAGGGVSISPASGQPLTFADPPGSTTLNLSGGAVTISSLSSVTVGNNFTLSSDNNISITTPMLIFGSSSEIATTGNSVPKGFPWISVTSPPNSGLIVQLPSGSSVILQTNGFRHCGNIPGCSTTNLFSNGKISGSVTLVGGVVAGTILGGVVFAPASGQTLSFVDSGSSPAALLANNGTLITGTIGVPTTVGSKVTLSSNAPVAMFVQDSTLFNNGTIASSCPTDGGFNKWRVIQLSGNGGTITIDRNDFSDPNGGTINATGITSTTIPDGPAGPAVFIGPSASVTINTSLNVNLTPLGFLIINADNSITFGDNVTLAVHGGGTLPFGTLSSGQSFEYSKVNIVAPSATFGANSSIITDVTSGYGIAVTEITGSAQQVNLLGSSATLQTSGGSIFVGPTTFISAPGPWEFPSAGQSLTFSTSTGASTLNFVGGSVLSVTQGAGIAINAGVDLISNKNITISTPVLTVNSSAVVSSLAALSVTSPSGLIVSNNGVMNATGVLSLSAAQGLTVSGSTGQLRGSAVTLTSTTNAVSVQQYSISGATSGTAGTAFSVTTSNSGLTIGNVTAMNGSVTAVAGTGVLSVLPSVTVKATEGNITLENANTTSGSIDIGKGSTLFAFTAQKTLNSVNPDKGNVSVTIGPPPPPLPSVGTAPANVVGVSVNPGKIYWGAHSIQGLQPLSTVRALAANVVFNTGSRPASAITLGGGVEVLADPPVHSTAITLRASIPAPIASTAIPVDVAGLAMPAVIMNPLPVPGTNSAVATDDLLSVPQQVIQQRGVLPNVDTGSAIDASQADGFGPDTSGCASDESPLKPIAFIYPASAGANPSAADHWSVAGHSGSTLDTTSRATTPDTSTAPTDASAGSDLVPISFIHPAATSLLTFGTSSGGTIVKHLGLARVSEQEPGVLALSSGEILVSAAEPTTINLGSHKLALAAGSVVLVSMGESSITIRTLWDRGKNSVCVTVKGQTLSIPVGHEVIVGVGDSRAQILDNVARRRIRTLNLEEGLSVASSEVSLVALMRSNSLLQQVLHSHEPGDRAITTKLMKMAASIMTLTGNHGAYSEARL